MIKENSFSLYFIVFKDGALSFQSILYMWLIKPMLIIGYLLIEG